MLQIQSIEIMKLEGRCKYRRKSEKRKTRGKTRLQTKKKQITSLRAQIMQHENNATVSVEFQ